MIDFQRVDVSKKAAYEALLQKSGERSCEYAFANLVMWGRQKLAFVGDFALVFSHFGGRSVYTFPVGDGDFREALDAIIADAHERGIPCRITGVNDENWKILDSLYPGQFTCHCNRDSFDYVYDINALADLKGKKLQQKRNHINRFEENYPDWHIRPLDESTIGVCRNLVDNWFYRRRMEDPHEDFQMEQTALRRGFAHFDQLGLEGLVLYAGGEPVAMTMGSRLSGNTFDVNFEKAEGHIQGAYAAINRAFARYLREKYPELQFLNREDDLGIPGLRKAKLSYNPHHLVEKCWCVLKEEGYDD